MAHSTTRQNRRLQVARQFTLAVLELKVRRAMAEGGNRLKWWQGILEIRKNHGWS